MIIQPDVAMVFESHSFSFQIHIHIFEFLIL